MQKILHRSISKKYSLKIIKQRSPKGGLFKMHVKFFKKTKIFSNKILKYLIKIWIYTIFSELFNNK